MYNVKETGQFERSLRKLLKKRRVDLQNLATVIDLLSKSKKLHQKYKNHKLHGKLDGIWECHIHSDVLLLYYTINDEGRLILYDLRTHDTLDR